MCMLGSVVGNLLVTFFQIVFVGVHIYAYLCMLIYIYIYIYICVCVCVCVCVSSLVLLSENISGAKGYSMIFKLLSVCCLNGFFYLL